MTKETINENLKTCIMLLEMRLETKPSGKDLYYKIRMQTLINIINRLKGVRTELGYVNIEDAKKD